MKKLKIGILEAQPSQMYINKEKLNIVSQKEDLEVIPVKKIGKKLFFTDGHSRVLSYYLKGFKEIEVYIDEDDMDWHLYSLHVKNCEDNNIKNISDLKNRIISEKEYKEKWFGFCTDLENKVKNSSLYDIKIEEVEDEKLKTEICFDILSNLPEWFGIEESIKEYSENVKKTIFLTAKIGDNNIGFFSVKKHNEYTAELYVLGILKEFHKKGLGKIFVNKIEKRLKSEKFKFLTVKTLSPEAKDESYLKTYNFYIKKGFYVLEEFKTLWGEENPCVFLCKTL
jgi:ribosomal protein S18 acetylase RimI-like enzyme